MYARVILGRYNVGDEAKIRRAVEMLLLPQLRQAPGFRRYLGGFNEELTTLVVVTLWETDQQARAMDAQPSPFGFLVRFEPAQILEVSAEA